MLKFGSPINGNLKSRCKQSLIVILFDPVVRCK